MNESHPLSMPRRLQATRYVVPLREGGSLPAVVEADDGALYVMKFQGAGQGRKALVAELIAGRIGQALGMPVPELVLLDMDEQLGRSEPNPEIRDLLRASVGLNVGMRYLPSALAYTPMGPLGDDLNLTAALASDIVWFDAYITNMDRTVRNVNMLLAEERLWLIDHGASLIFHHDWDDYLTRSRSPYPFVSQHVLLPQAVDLSKSNHRLRARLTDAAIEAAVAGVPDLWLGDEPHFESTEAHRRGYVDYLRARRAAADIFVEEALRVREQL
jgi:hypothetical protein